MQITTNKPLVRYKTFFDGKIPFSSVSVYSFLTLTYLQ